MINRYPIHESPHKKPRSKLLLGGVTPLEGLKFSMPAETVAKNVDILRNQEKLKPLSLQFFFSFPGNFPRQITHNYYVELGYWIKKGPSGPFILVQVSVIIYILVCMPHISLEYLQITYILTGKTLMVLDTYKFCTWRGNELKRRSLK